MTYTISPVFNKTLATEFGKGAVPTTSEPDKLIKVDVTVSGGAGSSYPNLQVFTSPSTLIVIDSDHNTVAGGDEGYVLKVGADGKCTFYLAAPTKTLSSISLVVENDPDSRYVGPEVFFSSYSGLTTTYGPPLLPVDEDGIIQLGGSSTHILVLLPDTTSSYQLYPRAQAALLINGTQFVSGPFNTIYNEGFQVPVNMLHEDAQNRFGYTIINGNDSISPVTAYATTEGEIITRPPASPLRTLNESPYLLNHAATLNDASSDVTVYIDCDGNPDHLQDGDVITVTVYINGWFQGSNIPNNTIFTLGVINFRSTSQSPLTAVIPKEKLVGFGMNAIGTPGTIYIDYSVKHRIGNNTYAMPKKYYAGSINTVGPT
ncbi:hypothetical protein [Ochrobactrum sp. CGA5]|uniref:hypothetical protein n=1 Tax=Ochrobactrum sp. CGA5 TaxID=2583453 RepID=UPI0011213450|nr:hypothetical protein [Ochrobactrum sp. CGA5]